jgi:hypothetical protein
MLQSEQRPDKPANEMSESAQLFELNRETITPRKAVTSLFLATVEEW